MPYAIRLPNGALVQNIPDEISQEEAKRRIIASGLVAEQTIDQAQTTEGGFFPAIKRGALQTGMLLGDVLPAMVARGFGADEYAERQLQEAAETQARIEREVPAAVPSFTDISSLGDAWMYAKEAVGESLVSLIPSLITGGAAGLLARPAVAAANQAAKEAAERALMSAAMKAGPPTQAAIEAAKKQAVDAGIKAAQKTALKYEIAGGVAGSAAQNIPEVYQNILEETGKESIPAALIAGGFNAALDSVLPIAILRKLRSEGLSPTEVMGAWYKRGAKGIGKGFLIEGGTEAAQESSSIAAENFVADNPEVFTPKNLERVINAGLKGGLGGGVITGVTDIATGRAPAPEISDRQRAEQLQREILDEVETARAEQLLAEQEAAERARLEALKPPSDDEVIDMARSENGYGKLENAKQRLMAQEQTAEVKSAIQTIQDIQSRIVIEEQQRRVPSIPAEMTDEVIRKTLGFAKSENPKSVYQQLIGKSASDPDVLAFLRNYADTKAAPQTKERINKFLERTGQTPLTAQEIAQGEADAGQAIGVPGGAGVAVAGEPGAGAAAPGVGITQPSGVVPPVEAVEQSDVGEGTEQPSVGQIISIPLTDRDAVEQHAVKGYPIIEAPLNQLSISMDVPQFKSDADKKGIVKPLEGKFERIGVAPIQLWRRLDGRLEVISGRHRFDLAQRTGETTIPAQIHDEASGFGAAQAATLDAELNIRDEQGEVKDYVVYFENSGITEADAKARGLLGRTVGQRGWSIASKGSPELIAAHRSGVVPDDAAAGIATLAPNDSRIQAVGLRAVQDNKSTPAVLNTVQAVQALATERGAPREEAGDLFGFDDSAIKEAEEMARIATDRQRSITSRLSAITGAANKPAVAKAEGIDIKDEQALNKRIQELKNARAAWNNWSTNPALIKEIRDEMQGISPVEPELPPVDQAKPLEGQAAKDAEQAGEDLLSAFSTALGKPSLAPSPPPKPVKLSKETEAKITELGKVLQRILGKFGLKNVALSIEQDLRVNGEYANRLIKLALDADSPVRDLRHESLHAMKELGFFSDAQWKTLEKFARDKWIDKYLKNRVTTYNGEQMSRYDAYMRLYNGSEDAVIEEAIADAFGDFDITKPPAGLMQTLLRRMRDLFRGIKESMGIANIDTAEDIFRKVEKSELRESVPVVNGEPERLSLRIPEDYRGEHRAPLKSSGSPAHDLTDVYPEDVYGPNGPRYYGHYGNTDDNESFDVILRVRNKPNVPLTIYRAVPKSAPSVINDGDWVTISKKYAKLHGESALRGDYKIISKLVHPRDIFTNGDSIHEWGYDPQPRIAGEEAKALGYKASLREVPLSTRGLMEVKPIIAMQELGLKTDAVRKPGGIDLFNDVRSIALALNQETIDQRGKIDVNDTSALARDKLAKAMVDEIGYQLRATAKTGTGKGWYSENFPNAVKKLSKLYPELATDPYARTVFSALVAITSNGEKVALNVKNAIKLYDDIRMGKDPSNVGSRRQTALNNNVSTVLALMNQYGRDGMRNELMREITVKDMNALLRARGEDPDTSYLANTKVPTSAIYFGPKLGAFFSNLEGAEGYLTMDMWWTRTVNRMRGQLESKATEASINKFREMMGQPNATREEVIAATIPLRNKYEEFGWTTELEHLVGRKEPAKTNEKPAWTARAKRQAGPAYQALLFEHRLEKMANTIYKNEYEMLEEAPFTANDREFMYRTARRAQTLLKEDGINLSLADIQAALWYYEKRLYQHLSGRKADDIGYDEAITQLARESDRPAGPSVVFGGQPVRGDEPARQGAGVAEVRGGPAKPSLRAPKTEAFKRWFGDSKVVDENGKPMVVYRGTDQDYGPTMRVAKEGALGAGIYTTPNPEFASSYAEGDSANVMPLYVSLQNPLVLRHKRNEDPMILALTQLGMPSGKAETLVEKAYEEKGYIGKQVMNRALSQGYDGIMQYRNGELTEVVAFSPYQIKSAIGNVGTFDVTSPDIRYSLRDSLGLYSELENKISQGPNKAAAPAWKAYINALPQKGVKPEEIEWSGVRDWLDLQTGPITKDAVNAYLKQGGVRVEETVLKDKRGLPDEIIEDIGNRFWPAVTASGLDADVVDESMERGDLDVASLPAELREDAQILQNDLVARRGGITKYGQYTLPGGENYREVLLKLPSTEPETSFEWTALAGGEGSSLRVFVNGIVKFDSKGKAYPTDKVDEAEREALRAAGVAPTAYRSSHWDQPNVIAHIRLNDRTDRDGNKVLFVEEIQSDWGQEGKKKGFVSSGKLPEGWTVHQTGPGGSWYVIDNSNTQVGIYKETREEAIISATTRQGFTGGTPVAPFVTKTEGWLNLALKRVMIMAAEGGYDKVAFVNGEQSAERYDLSKQVSSIEYARDDKNGTIGYVVRGDTQARDGVIQQGEETPSKLEEIIGKELVKKMLDGPEEGTLSGLDLKVGGEGMKTFYDTIVPTALKKLLPKVGGGQLMPVQMEIPGATNRIDKPRMETIQQPGFTVTPDMQRKVETTGLPLFSKKGVSANQLKDFEQALRTLLNKFGLKDVGLSIIEGMQDAGSYAQQLIRIADRADNPIRTLRHEAIHALRELGFFTDAQWKSLSKMAKDKWIDQYLKQRNVDGKPLKAGEESRYDAYMREYDGDMEKITEEAVADAFADFDATKPPSGLLQTLLRRLRDFFQAMKSALTKVESVDQIFGKVEEGKLKPGEKAESGERKSVRDRATANFLRWFGDSKVVDENGEPLVMYHGTTRGGFSVFDRLKSLGWRGPSMDTVGSWFSNNPSDTGGAGLYAKAGGDGDTIYPVYLSIKNPKKYRTFSEFLRHMHRAAGRPMPENAPGRGSTEELRNELISEGYDGIEFEQTDNTGLMNDIKQMQDAVERAKQEEFSVKRVDRLPYTQKRERLEKTLKSMRKELDEFGSSTEFDEQRVFIAFEPTQIKSAIGNNGDYSLTDPDIRKSLSGKRSTQEIARIFEKMVKRAESELSSALFNWNDSRLNEDKDKIIMYPGRDRKFVRGKEGGKSNVSKAEFIDWLMSDGPFDTSVYGEDITRDAEWRGEIETLRSIIETPDVRKSLGDIRAKAAKAREDIIEAGREAGQKRKLDKGAFEGVDEDLFEKLKPVFAPRNRTIQDRIIDMRDNFWQRVAQGMADQFRTIKDYSYDAYMKARLSKSIDGGLEGLMFYGQVFNDGGALNIKKNTRGMFDVLKPVGKELDRYLIYIALSRDAALPDSKRSIDPALVARRGELIEGTLNGKPRKEVYEQVRKDMNVLNRSVLKVAVDAGLLNTTAGAIKDIENNESLTDDQKREKIEELRKNPIGYERFINDLNYIPFYKIMEDGDTDSVAKAVSASGLTSQYFSKALKGGEKPFGDLMENTLKNWSHILSASMKNQAAVAAMDAAVKAGAAVPNLKPQYDFVGGQVVFRKNGEVVGDGSIRADMTEQEKGAVKIVVDGKNTYYNVSDPLLMDSITSIGFLGTQSKFLDVARDFKNLLQYGVTISPQFRVNNLIRDAVGAMGVSELRLNPIANVLQGVSLSNRNSPTYIAAMAGGGMFNFGTAYEGDQSKMIKRLLKMGVDRDHILDSDSKIKNGLRYAWDKYQEWGNKAENANRLALYQQLRDKGMSHLEATFKARDLMDFSMQGSWPAFRVLTQVIPFLNARVQGLYKLGRDGISPTARVIRNTVTGEASDASDKQKAQQFSIVLMGVTLASALLYLTFKDDEEYKRRDDWDKDNFWWFRVPGMEFALRVPKPFEIGAFGTVVERTLEQILDSGAEGKEFGDALWRMLTSTFAINPIPQVFKPLVDIYANKDSFTGAPIESAGLERLSKQERMVDTTSPLAIALGKVSTLFPETFELSPVQADYLIKGYLGWLGGTIAMTSTYATMPFREGEYPDARWLDRASLGLARELPGRGAKFVTAFYESNKEIAQAYADMRHYAAIGDSQKVQELLEEKGDKIRLAKFYDNVATQMANIRKQIRLTQTDKLMDGAPKKEAIDRMQDMIAMLAKQAEDIRKQQKK